MASNTGRIAPPGYPTKFSSAVCQRLETWSKRTDVLDTLSEHHLVEDLSATHSNEAAMKLGVITW
jgi:hypothetical protein